MWSGGSQSSLTMYHEKAKRESQRFEETLRGSKSESPRPHLPQPFLSPTPETHPGKKICIYLQNKKGRAAKIPANAGVIKKQSAAATPTPPTPFLPPASPLLPLTLPFIFFFWQHGSLNEKKCKCCRPRQRLRHLFQRVTPLSEFRFHLLLLNPHV